MTKKNGKQGDSLTPDANGDFSVDELKAMYAMWLRTEDEKGLSPAGEWMTSLVPHISVHSVGTSSTHPSVTFHFTVQEGHSNRHGTLHGGCGATLFDYLTTLPLNVIARPGGYWQQLGVSRNLNVTYLRPVKVGDEVLIETEVLQVSKRLAILRGTMRRKGDGKVVMMCEHQKVNIDKDAHKL
ncbi:Thioesterase/thiol ester dehydrase-isomerase [Sarocladium strictum]